MMASPSEAVASSPSVMELRNEMARTRARTLEIADCIEADRCERIHEGYSPFDWHLGHIGNQEAFWVLQKAAGQRSFAPDLDFLFANIPENPKSQRNRLPPRAVILQYLQEIRLRTMELLDGGFGQTHDPLTADYYCFRFVMSHEWQHQETMLELLYLASRRIHTVSFDWWRELASLSSPTPMALVPGCAVQLGSNELHVYDNEKPAHRCHVESFEIELSPVTVAQFAAFVAEGGYARHEFWSEEGWEWRKAKSPSGPEHLGIGIQGTREVNPREPVMGVNLYEAEAYAAWVDRRLPSEAEWEKAAVGHSAGSVQSDFEEGPSQVGGRVEREGNGFATGGPSGLFLDRILKMPAGVWEWTSTVFDGYDGFQAFPYEGYSKDHFDGRHRVLKGGSWATHPRLRRPSFRNFYTPDYRQGFVGFRCARDP